MNKLVIVHLPHKILFNFQSCFVKQKRKVSNLILQSEMGNPGGKLFDRVSTAGTFANAFFLSRDANSLYHCGTEISSRAERSPVMKNVPDFYSR